MADRSTAHRFCSTHPVGARKTKNAFTIVGAILARSAASVGACLVAAGVSSCRERATAASELRITSTEYGYSMPDSVPAGLVHVILRNAGQDIHEAVLVKFTDATLTAAAYADSVRAHVDFPTNAEDVGGAALTMPGDSSGVWLPLSPGHYAVVCWKGDHLSRGMVHDLWVVPSNAVATVPPKATRQLTLSEFAFSFDTTLVAGTHMLHVRNAGTEPHEADIFRATPTVGLREYVAWLDAGERGMAPAAPVAAFGDLFPGKEAWVELHLTPGRYFILCRVPAKSDGKPHSKHGMSTEFVIQ
ncbi:MAG: sulfocyanin-like copper-binding protein [Gemmatimonadaceae bacterium]